MSSWNLQMLHEDVNALFCGYQERFVPGVVQTGKSGSQYCALDEENSNGMDIDPNVKLLQLLQHYQWYQVY